MMRLSAPALVVLLLFPVQVRASEKAWEEKRQEVWMAQLPHWKSHSPQWLFATA